MGNRSERFCPEPVKYNIEYVRICCFSQRRPARLLEMSFAIDRDPVVAPSRPVAAVVDNRNPDSRVVAARRHQLILEQLRRSGSVRVTDLTSLLGVSDMTVRRDLDVLSSSGLLLKVHGGAAPMPDGARNAEEPGFAEKSGRQTAEKIAIAAAAATLVRPGTAIGVSAGTTTWHFVQCLLDIANLIVVTNSIRVADVLHNPNRSDRSVILTGGERTPSDALVGPLAAHALDGLHLDQVFLGVHGMSPRAGFSTPNLMEAETNRCFVKAADKLVVLADHSKWRTVGLSTFARLDEADVLVSDAGLLPEARDALGSAARRLVLA
jgi:DeoR/GlpR family transcriptional regulator of sugar metabolism